MFLTLTIIDFGSTVFQLDLYPILAIIPFESKFTYSLILGGHNRLTKLPSIGLNYTRNYDNTIH